MILLLCDRCLLPIKDDHRRILAGVFDALPDDDDPCKLAFCGWECTRLYAMQQIAAEKAGRPNGG